MKRVGNICGMMALVLASAAVAIVSLALLGPDSTFDTLSYLREWDGMTSGRFPLERTPGYPAFLAFCRLIGGEAGMLWLAAALQWLVFIAVIPLAWQTVRLIGCGAKSAFILLFAGFCCCVELWVFNNAANPESLCLSGLVIYTWAMVRMWHGDMRPRTVAMMLLDLLWLLALRPAMVYMLPVTALFLFIMLFRRGSRLTCGLALAGTLALGGAYALYCGEIYKRTGVFSSTLVSVTNDWAVSRGARMVDGDFFPRTQAGDEMRWWVEQCRDDYTPGEMSNELQWQAAGETERYIASVGQVGYGQITHVLSASRRSHPDLFLKGFAARAKASLTHPFGISNLATAYLFLFLYMAWLIWIWKKRGEFSWPGALLWTLAASHLLVSLLGAMNSWDRLDFPAWPLFLLMAATLMGKRQEKRGAGVTKNEAARQYR